MRYTDAVDAAQMFPVMLQCTRADCNVNAFRRYRWLACVGQVVLRSSYGWLLVMKPVENVRYYDHWLMRSIHLLIPAVFEQRLQKKRSCTLVAMVGYGGHFYRVRSRTNGYGVARHI